MSNWIQITEADLIARKAASVIARAKSLAPGEEDPVASITAEVIAELRSRASAGNNLDADPAKIPMSLKGLACRMIIRALKTRIQSAWTPDEQSENKTDDSFLNRIVDDQLRFEKPDINADSAEMQGPGIGTVTVNTRPNLATRDQMSGL